MDKDNKYWKDAFHKMKEYQAPDNNDLFWKSQLQGLPKHTTEKAFVFIDDQKTKKITKRIALLILSIILVLLLVYLVLFMNDRSDKEITNEPSGNIAMQESKDDLMDKTFENFCYDYKISCDDLYETDIAQRWNNNQKSYQMTLAAIAQLGETDFLNRQLTYLRLNQTEMVTEIINNI